MPPIKRIEINFPVEVELPSGWDKALSALVNIVCQRYMEDNPMRTMWPAGHGAKILWNEPHEPDHDSSVYCIDVAEKSASAKDIARRLQYRRMQQGNITNTCAMGLHTICQERLDAGQLRPEAVCECPCHRREAAVNGSDGADPGRAFLGDPEKGGSQGSH